MILTKVQTQFYIYNFFLDNVVYCKNNFKTEKKPRQMQMKSERQVQNRYLIQSVEHMYNA